MKTLNTTAYETITALKKNRFLKGSINVYDSNHVQWNRTMFFVFGDNTPLHFTSDYHKIFEKPGKETAFLFVYIKEGFEIFSIPFIKRKINEVYSDATSVFGYTGPVTNSNNRDFLESANCAYKDFLQESNVVSELVRFDPITENQNLMTGSISLVELKPYVINDLSGDLDSIFHLIHPGMRRHIKTGYKRLKGDIHITRDTEKMSEFFGIYIDNMKSKNANDYYLFWEDFYRRLAMLIKKYGFLIFYEKYNKIKAGIVFLNNGIISYAHQCARDCKDGDSSCANKLLWWEAFKRLKEDGIEKVLLGGGISCDPTDSLLHFKKQFGGYLKGFWLGKRVLIDDAYDKFCRAWEENYP